MHLTPRERERLLLAAAADLARRRLARGAPLGATEAVALVCDEICEMAWDGVPLAEVIDRARNVLTSTALLPGVPSLVPVLEVEALFPWGSTLVHVDAPFRSEEEEDLYSERTGVTLPAPGSIALAAGAVRRSVVLTNIGPRDVWISSHFPLDQINSAVAISGSARHCRLDLPAGEALLLRPGEQREAVVVEFPR
ncbi:MAG TPA: urease subunit gamma [Trebonia sp.]|nr:urease subunit gamma [Trebonia sp.]